MEELIKEKVLDDLEWGEVDIDYLANEIYNSEMNFNNADPTSGMRCWEEWQIVDEITKVLNQLKS